MHFPSTLFTTALFLLPTLTPAFPFFQAQNQTYYQNQTNPYNQTTQLGHAIVRNNCAFPIYLWSVASTVSEQQNMTQGALYAETFRWDPQTGGVGIKLATVPNGLETSAPQTIFAYNLVGDRVWYDLSDVFGDPFRGSRVLLDGEVTDIVWERGVPPAGSRVGNQRAGVDLVLTVC
ncbi:bys1 family protein [Aspergillus bombycis]|uniref:Bys1 family protein n=1 Tax=Aspergillus bombycis TaxID=109264 RepID=A0A1F8AF44_9EURO|nr:bys1 family protein [Aspergillus bombycis]OGM50383.1 bys1 family protein [Aspergillus bombycis]